ncbi:MAG TPA: hypothetical protein VGO62_12100, partial [Myxococcota bacterium]
MMDVIKLLVKLGLQSVAAHKRKSFIVGGLMAFGAFIVVIGTSLLFSITHSMRGSLVDSITGDVQVYAKDAKDQLQIFGFGLGNPDIGEMPNFGKVRDVLMKIDNVKAVVPMGLSLATVSSPGDLDRALEELRDSVRKNDKIAQEGAIASVKRLALVLQDQRLKRSEISSSKDDADADAIIKRVTSGAVWDDFAKDPLPVLDELDGKLAPLGDEGQQIYLRLAGTDLDAFKKNFSKMKIISGQMVPEHQRGMLVGQKFLDKRAKIALATNLDTIQEELGKGKKIATDQVLGETVTKEVRLSPRLLYMLSAQNAGLVEKQLRDAGIKGADLSAQLKDFFAMDDSNFATRYKLFYDVIAPRVQLYPFKVGDTITLQSFTNSGYLKSVNVKVWGTYAFEGLESSDLAGALSLVDMMTLRDSYGARTQELDQELANMKKSVGASDIKREDAEAEMFGGGDSASKVEEKKETVLKDVDEGTLSTKA